MIPIPNHGVFDEREGREASQRNDGGARSNADAWRDRIEDDDRDADPVTDAYDVDDALDAGDERLDALDFAEYACPWCGEPGEALIDACEFATYDGRHDAASWVEDCAVCCRPIVFTASLVGGHLQIQVRAEGE